jgi:hypothetical protein
MCEYSIALFTCARITQDFVAPGAGNRVLYLWQRTPYLTKRFFYATAALAVVNFFFYGNTDWPEVSHCSYFAHANLYARTSTGPVLRKHTPVLLAVYVMRYWLLGASSSSMVDLHHCTSFARAQAIAYPQAMLATALKVQGNQNTMHAADASYARQRLAV